MNVPAALQGWITIYCERFACAAREIHIRTKDHGTEEPILGEALRCPICGSHVVSIHSVLTDDEQAAVDAEDARRQVNTQMFVRDRIASGDMLPLTPVTVLLDDRLPPTPPGWWDRT